MSAPRSRRHGRGHGARVAAVLAASAALLAATLLPVVGSNASWRDDEWVQGAAATLDCAKDNTFATQASGKLLGGSLLSSELDDVAELEAMTVTNDGTAAHPAPGDGTHLDADADGDLDGEDAWANPLRVVALGTVPVPGVGALSDVLAVDAEGSLGSLNQYARARSNGYSQGASGMVNDSGAVDPGAGSSGETPTLGTVKLSALVQALTGSAVGEGVSDLSLGIGAVAGRATLDACEYEWTGDLAANLERTYVITALDALLETGVGDELRNDLDDALVGVAGLASGISGDSAVSAAIESAVTSTLDGALGALELGGVDVDDLTVTLDLDPVAALGTATISDDAGTVELDLETGAVSVDLAALMGKAYGGEEYDGTGPGLNQLAPNTNLLMNADVTKELTSALTEALDAWVADVVAALERQLDLASVSTTVTSTLSTEVLLLREVDVATLEIRVDGTLQQLTNNDVEPTVTTSILDASGLDLGVLEQQLAQAVSDVTGALGSAGFVPALGQIVEDALRDEDGAVTGLAATLTTAAIPVEGLLSQVLNDYLGADGPVSLTANVQNDPLTGTAAYPEWENGSTREVPPDRFDVAALGLSVLDVNGPSDNVALELGRSSVGVNCLLGGTWDLAGRCDGY